MAMPIEELVQIRELCRLTGGTVRVRPQDEVVKVGITDTTASVLLRRVHVDQSITQSHYRAADLVIILFVRAPDTGNWERQLDLVSPDPTFTPYVVQEWGRVVSPTEYKEQLRYEADCYRPGSDSRLGGRDSFYRVTTDPYADEAGLQSMWDQHEKVIYHSSSEEN